LGEIKICIWSGLKYNARARRFRLSVYFSLLLSSTECSSLLPPRVHRLTHLPPTVLSDGLLPDIMNVPSRPRVQLSVLNNGDRSTDSVVIELPSTRRSNTFSISYATDQRPSGPTSNIAQKPPVDSSEGENDIQSSDEGESEIEIRDRAKTSATSTPVPGHLHSAPGAATPHNTYHPPFTPQFSRTMSMPLPSQLSHLQHPHRPQLRAVQAKPLPSPSSLSPINALSVELADSYQMVIQTMLQVSPPQVLEFAREQYSAYSLSVPTPSMSAMFTAMKTLNYMSANLSRLFNDSESIGYSDGEGKIQNVFDIGELLQCVGDALSGVVAQVGVDLVLFHGDVNMKHVSVKGDECGIMYALLHVSRLYFLSFAIKIH
jgi:osomolarity two-component system response regulator SSK1